MKSNAKVVELSKDIFKIVEEQILKDQYKRWREIHVGKDGRIKKGSLSFEEFIKTDF